MLKTISFEIDEGDFVAVTPFVDGTSLATLVEIYERSKGYLDPAGGYGGLVPAYFNFGPLDKYFTGRNKADYWASLNGIYLLGCACGEVGCWPLIASVSEQDDKIIWDGFVQPFRRSRDYSEFGPFLFSRVQYEDAVDDLVARLETIGTKSST